MSAAGWLIALGNLIAAEFYQPNTNMNQIELPKSPEDMPGEFHNGADQQLRNCLMSLDQFVSVNIAWEMDVIQTNSLGESCGEWSIEIMTARKTFKAKHECITNALWFAYTLAEAADSEAYDLQEKARKAALAKLTPDDLRALRLA